MKILNINFSKTPEDKLAWSGTAYKAYIGLKGTGADVDHLFCDSIGYAFPEFFQKVYGYTMRHVVRKKFSRMFSIAWRDSLYRFLVKQDFSGYDYIFVTASSAIASALRLALEKQNCKTPYIVLSDATFSALHNYYPTASNLLGRSIKQANEIGKHAYEGAYKIIFSSEWSKQHAVEDYNIDPTKIVVIPFGANIDDPVLGTISKDYTDKTRFNLFLSGIHWGRKGGDIAIQCCRNLIVKGVNVTLHIAGMSVPKEYGKLDFVVEHGFLNKNNKAQYAEFVELQKQMDLMLFPSKAECSSIALCEAAGFGLPVLCYDTGGLANYVINDVNGYRMPMNATGDDFAEMILKWIHGDLLTKYSKGASELYRDRLNWNRWSEAVKNKVLV